MQCPSDNPPGDCAPHAELTARLLEAMDFEVERHPVPAEFARQHGMRSVTNLIVRQRFGDGPVIALNAHGDVVPPGAGWTGSPYGGEVRDGWLYGRGAAVSKSDFTTYAFALRALKALRASGAALAGTVELHLTYDEETGGMTGPGWILSQGLSRPDYVISAAFSHHVVVAHNGCLHLEVMLRGKSAHAARPDTGADAIEAAATLLPALYRHRDQLAERPSQTPGITHPHDGRRPDRGRHQHQRGGRHADPADRPPHRARGSARGRRGRTARRSSKTPAARCRASRSRSGRSCWRARSRPRPAPRNSPS